MEQKEENVSAMALSLHPIVSCFIRCLGQRWNARLVRRGGMGVVALGLLTATAPARAQALTEDRVLLLYNSANADSAAVRDLYLAVHPGVLEFDLNDPALSPADPNDLGNITRAEYLSEIRAPLLAFLSTTLPTGEPLAEHVVAIATTRGLPARIMGLHEFQLWSGYSSLESELSLVQQDLTGAGPTPFDTTFEGAIDNPYHFLVGQSILSFDRTAIAQQKTFQLIGASAWQATDLTPGDIYLVCRLDSAPSATATALENIDALLQRSQSLAFDPNGVQALLDEYAPEFDQLDDDGGLFFPTNDDYDDTTSVLTSAGVETLHDETFNFVTGSELPDQTKPLIVLGTYGENHDINGWGANPPGPGTYISTYTNLHPACVFVSYESFNGNSIINGTPRSNQAQAMDFIAQGGSFTIAHVAEPFSFTVSDLEMLSQNLLVGSMTFAEAAYSAIPALSWQSTPIGDPLATVAFGSPSLPADLNGDGVVNGADLATLLTQWGTNGPADLNSDGVVNGADLATLLTNWTL